MSDAFPTGKNCPLCRGGTNEWGHTAPCYAVQKFHATLGRRGIITTNPDEAETCCGIPRDADGFCQHRPGHPIYVASLRHGGDQG